jgi:hypothetical protein
MNNKNYRVMKFFEPVNKLDKSRGYVRLDIRGVKGNILVAVENLGDAKTTSEVFLYKDKNNKIKLGDINNKKGMLKKLLTFGSNNAIEDYNICAVVKDNRIVMFSNLFNTSSLEQIRKLELDEEKPAEDVVSKLEDNVENAASKNDEKVAEADKPSIATEEDITTKEEDTKDVKKDEKLAENEEPIEDKKVDAAQVEDERIKKTSVSSAVDIRESVQYEEQKQDDVHGQSQANRFRNRFDENLYNVLKDYSRIEPLSVKLKNFEWWYIPYDETGIKNGFLPYYNQIISSYYPYPMSNRVTTCASLMNKYGHYIFGVYKEKGDIVKFIYGIPGEFTREEQPYKGVTGFKNWSYSNKGNSEKQGYWLAFVNPKTGETTEPPQVVMS